MNPHCFSLAEADRTSRLPRFEPGAAVEYVLPREEK
jgi:hypothetical protein